MTDAPATNELLALAPMTSIKEALHIARGYIADDVKRKPSEYDPSADLSAVDAALAQLDSADARERIARIIAGPLCDATKGDHSAMAQGNYKFCTQCGETVSKRGIGLVEARNKADAILSTGLLPDADVREKLASALADNAALRSANTKLVLAERDRLDALHEKLGRFGHHPDPAIDFCIEVECIENEWSNIKANFTNGTPSRKEIEDRVFRAMQFRVGGDTGAVDAKAVLRKVEAEMRADASPGNGAEKVREALRISGVGRDAEHDKSLCFYFSRRVTDDEMRFLHEVMQRAVACAPKDDAK